MPPRSKVWQYFDKVPDGGKCKLCDPPQIVSSKGGNTTNLFCHLRRIHRVELQPHKSIIGKLTNEVNPVI